MDIALLYRGSLFFPGARPSDRRAEDFPASCSSSTGTARRRTADADRHPPALATERRASYRLRGARNAPESRRFDLAPRSRPQIAGNGRLQLHDPNRARGRPGTGHTRSGRHRLREGTYRRVPLYTPLARAEPPKLRHATPTATTGSCPTTIWISGKLRPRRAVPRLRLGHGGSLRARLAAPFRSGPFKGYPLRTFRSARIHSAATATICPYTSSWKHRNRNKAETGSQRAEPLACSKKKSLLLWTFKRPVKNLVTRTLCC